MPPRKTAAPKPDAETPVDAPADLADEAPTAPKARAAKKETEAPCSICFPAGWPEGVTSAGCEHGSVSRVL